MADNNLAQQIMSIQRDPNLTDAEKAQKRQMLLSGKWMQQPSQDSGGMWMLTCCLNAGFNNYFAGLITFCCDLAEANDTAAVPSAPAMFDDSLKCTMCMELCARPVTVSYSS